MKLRDCDACAPGLPCVMHTYLPPEPMDEDVPAAKRIDSCRSGRALEREAPTRRFQKGRES